MSTKVPPKRPEAKTGKPLPPLYARRGIKTAVAIRDSADNMPTVPAYPADGL